MNSRREFIKQSCVLCAGVPGLFAMITQLQGCKAMDIYKTSALQNIITVPLTSMLEKKLLIVRNANSEFDILLVKKNEREFNALLMKCTHNENILSANRHGLFCTTHGSEFDFDGNVTRNPAINPLRKYKTEISDSNILINLNS